MKYRSFFLLMSLLIATETNGQNLFTEELSDYELSVLRYRAISAQNSLETLEQLQTLFMYMEFNEGNCEQAFEIENSAMSGDAHSQWILADLYRNGVCVPQNDRSAFQYLQRSANQNNKNAQYDLGIFHREGIGTTINLSQAASWLLRAANQDHTDAQIALGLMYQNGTGVTQNYAEALSWYEASFNLGNYDACTRSGILQYQIYTSTGEGLDTALNYFREGAEHNVHACQAILGELLFDSSSQYFAPMEAHMWANLATQSEAENVLEIALGLRNRITESLSNSELLEAQRIAASWKPIEELSEDPYGYDVDLPSIDSDVIAQISTNGDAINLLQDLNIPVSREAFFQSIEDDNLNIFKLFYLAGADIEATSPLDPGVTPLYLSVDFGADDIFNYLIENGANINATSLNSGMTPLIRAFAHSRNNMIEALLELNADATARPESREALLQATALSYSLFEDNPNYLRKILELGGSVNERYSSNNSPLHIAVRDSYINSIPILIDFGADINYINDFNQTPLKMALSKENPEEIDINIIETLLLNGANPNLGEDGTEISPLMMATMHGRADVISLLISYGSIVDQRHQLIEGKVPFIANEYESSLLMNGTTPLMFAVNKGFLGAMRELVNAGADITLSINIDGVEKDINSIAFDSGTTSALEIAIQD